MIEKLLRTEETIIFLERFFKKLYKKHTRLCGRSFFGGVY